MVGCNDVVEVLKRFKEVRKRLAKQHWQSIKYCLELRIAVFFSMRTFKDVLAECGEDINTPEKFWKNFNTSLKFVTKYHKDNYTSFVFRSRVRYSFRKAEFLNLIWGSRR